MPSINLLPKDLLPDARILKISKLLKNLVTVGLAVFIIYSVGFGAYFIINNLTLKNSKKVQETLTNTIRSQESTEQGLILVKDRLAKAKEIGSKPNLTREVTDLTSFLKTVPPEALLTEAILAKDKIDMTYTVGNSLSLTRFMAGVITVKSYKRINLLSFSFNPSVGYMVSLSFDNK